MTTPASLLYPEAFLSPLAIGEAVQRALDEDLGRAAASVVLVRCASSGLSVG